LTQREDAKPEDWGKLGKSALALNDWAGAEKAFTSLLPALTLPDHPFVGRVVLCEEKVGLSGEHMQTIVDALQRPIRAPGESEGRKIAGEGAR